MSASDLLVRVAKVTVAVVVGIFRGGFGEEGGAAVVGLAAVAGFEL